MTRFSHLSSLRNSQNAPHAKRLRAEMTNAERKLWYYLRGQRFEGAKFRRQVVMGDYIVDFVCEKARLIIEVDGGQHGDQREYDDARTAWLNARGYSLMRFWNNDVLGNVEGVLQALLVALAARKNRPSPQPLPKGEGAL
jgi:very-short-patch-repair endonuclease